jgi:hypothetical protein
MTPAPVPSIAIESRHKYGEMWPSACKSISTTQPPTFYTKQEIAKEVIAVTTAHQHNVIQAA